MKKIVPDVVKDQHLLFVSGRDTVYEAAQIMVKNRTGALMVMKNKTLEGIITERDLLVKVVAKALNPKDTTVSQVMTKNPDCVGPDDTALSALETMRKKGFRHLPVVEDGKVVGVVSIRDLYASVKVQLEDDLRERDQFIFGAGYGG